MWVEPLESRVLLTAIYFASMDADPGWNLQGLWQYGDPASNPSYAYTGSNCVGVNLAGNYQDYMGAQYATTPAIDCSGYEGVYLDFYRWFGIESSSFDHAAIQISNDGATWHTLWNHQGPSFTDPTWTHMVYNVSNFADNQPMVYIRWQMGPTDGSVTYTGWQLDDVSLTGTEMRPTAAVYSADDLRLTGASTYEFQIEYTSVASAINPQSLDGNDVQVTGPGDSTLNAQYVGVAQSSAHTWVATYQVTGPGGDWDAADAGVYSIDLQPDQVFDTSGDSVVGGTIGDFKAWRILTFDGRQPAVFQDQDGDTVTVALKGPGEGEARLLGDAADLDQLVLGGTSLASSLTVAVNGPNGLTTIHDTFIDGSLKGFIARACDFEGELDISGAVKSLTLGNVAQGGTIQIGQDVKPCPVTIALGSVAGLDLRCESPIKSLSAVEWLNPEGKAVIEAATIKSLTVAGDFQPDLLLSGIPGNAVTLQTARIAGDVADSEWWILDDVKSVTIGGEARNWDLVVEGNLSAVGAGVLEHVEVDVTGDAGAFRVADWYGGSLRAGTLKSLTAMGDGDETQGNLFMNMNIIGSLDRAAQDGPPPVVLGKVTAGEDIGGRWRIDGSAGSIVAGDEIGGWELEVNGNMKSIVAGTIWETGMWINGLLTTLSTGSVEYGDFEFGAVKTVTCAGDWYDCDLDLRSYNVAVSVNKLTINGWLEGSRIEARSSLGSVVLGGIAYSQVGVALNDDGFPDSIEDFADEQTLKSLTCRGLTRGDNPHSWIDSVIAAWNIGKLSLCNVQRENQGTPHGIACVAMGSYRLVQPDSSVYTDPADLPDPLDFQVRMLNPIG